MAIVVEASEGYNVSGKHRFAMWSTLFEVDKKYVPMKPIGRGSYGVVCSSINKKTNEKVAIKKIMDVFENRVSAIRTLREMTLLRSIKHENIVQLKEVMMPTNWRGFKELYMVYELMDTDLQQLIRSPQPMSNDHCRFFIFQVLRGLKYLHSANILHRDLKPANLLVNANCELKICDFGLARTGSDNGEMMTEYVVTRWYRAPEILLSCNNYGPSVDIWSVGCILAEILGRKPIFPGTSSLHQLKLIVSVLGTQSEAHHLQFIDNPMAKMFVQSLISQGIDFTRLYPKADPLAIDLLRKLLVFDPSKRITATEALCHPYISSLYDPSCSPQAECGLKGDVDENMEEQEIRQMMLREILYYKS
ncbi:hypothetical protein DH2020_001077 [Rehmannia glutinosa]|uniref:Mitogen-activated protein kinase n=1 Tax=Rehmannia glutinosa TaxID=99300 RepID=A0ABR0XYR3_REHGL